MDNETERLTNARYSLAGRLPHADVADEGARLRSVLQDKLGDEQTAWIIVVCDAGLDDPTFAVPFEDFRTSSYRRSSPRRASPQVGQAPHCRPSVLRVVQDADDIKSFPGTRGAGRRDLGGHP